MGFLENLGSRPNECCPLRFPLDLRIFSCILRLRAREDSCDAIMLPPNPIKKYRDHLGLSLTELEKQSDIHRQVIIRTEQGCYASIPPRLYAFFTARLGEGNPTLADEYSEWQDKHRGESFGRLTPVLPAYNINKHPFIQWREDSGLGRMEFCKAFCVHPSTVARFETQPQKQQTIPQQLREALETSGYWTPILDDLSVRYNIYRGVVIARSTGSPDRIIRAETQGKAYLALHGESVSEHVSSGFHHPGTNTGTEG